MQIPLGGLALEVTKTPGGDNILVFLSLRGVKVLTGGEKFMAKRTKIRGR